MKIERNVTESVKVAYENLANAIIADAVGEYRAAIRTHDEARIKRLRKWFRSDYCHDLSRINIESMLARVEREELERIRQNKKRA